MECVSHSNFVSHLYHFCTGSFINYSYNTCVSIIGMALSNGSQNANRQQYRQASYHRNQVTIWTKLLRFLQWKWKKNTLSQANGWNNSHSVDWCHFSNWVKSYHSLRIFNAAVYRFDSSSLDYNIGLPLVVTSSTPH